MEAGESGYPDDACAPFQMSDSRGLKSTRTAEAPAMRRPADRMEVDAAPAAPTNAESAPDLPPDLLRRIALESLQSHGGALTQWLRLSLVCKDWHSFLLGELGPISTRHAVSCSLTTCAAPLTSVKTTTSNPQVSGPSHVSDT